MFLHLHHLCSSITEGVYVYPCEWNFRPDACMYSLNCHRINDHGVSIIHGNRGVYHNDKQLPFRAIYETFRSVSNIGTQDISSTFNMDSFELFRLFWCWSVKIKMCKKICFMYKSLTLWTLGSLHVSVPLTLSDPVIRTSISIGFVGSVNLVITTFHLLIIYVANYRYHLFFRFCLKIRFFDPNHDYNSS